MLSLKETARVVGEIKIKTLMIEPNALFTGTCDMGQVTAPAVKK